MDDTIQTNFAELRGAPSGAPSFSHESRGERFFTFPLETRRLSGAADVINITAREQLLRSAEICSSGRLHVTGELRSFNSKRGSGARLVISVFARELQFDAGEDINRVLLRGTVCKPPTARVTPMGRDICDVMLAVNRRYGRSDYLPCICWGLRAREAASWQVGDRAALSGRIQSRQYIKVIDGEALTKTAYEVSVIEMERL